jgi:hypothetical protein
VLGPGVRHYSETANTPALTVSPLVLSAFISCYTLFLHVYLAYRIYTTILGLSWLYKLCFLGSESSIDQWWRGQSARAEAVAAVQMQPDQSDRNTIEKIRKAL